MNNTSDLDKPISTATQTALDAKLATTANAVSATRWATARALTFTGGATGSGTIDGSGNVSIPLTVADDSHAHIISNVDGLQTALDAKAPLASPTFTGTATATTFVGALTGNSSTATKLATARSINGTNFDGSANITTSKWGAARTITLNGDVNGAIVTDGSANKTVATYLSNTGVSAGEYTKVSVDAKGRVTAGSNPTTLSGYGITDAYTKSENVS